TFQQVIRKPSLVSKIKVLGIENIKAELPSKEDRQVPVLITEGTGQGSIVFRHPVTDDRQVVVIHLSCRSRSSICFVKEPFPIVGKAGKTLSIEVTDLAAFFQSDGRSQVSWRRQSCKFQPGGLE